MPIIAITPFYICTALSSIVLNTAPDTESTHLFNITIIIFIVGIFANHLFWLQPVALRKGKPHTGRKLKQRAASCTDLYRPNRTHVKEVAAAASQSKALHIYGRVEESSSDPPLVRDAMDNGERDEERETLIEWWIVDFDDATPSLCWPLFGGPKNNGN